MALDLFELSLVHHPPTNGCVVLSKDRPFCPNCGVGYAEVKENEDAK